MNTQIILIIISDIACIIVGIIVGPIIKRNPKYKPSNSRTETVKNISLSKITEFVTEKLSEDEEIEIIKAAEKDPKIAIMITKMTNHLHNIHRRIKSRSI